MIAQPAVGVDVGEALLDLLDPRSLDLLGRPLALVEALEQRGRHGRGQESTSAAVFAPRTFSI
ncbi:hypothetical protein WME86_21525 [Sorangium sp. So ce1024]